MCVVGNEIVRRLIKSNIVNLTENSRKENPTYANCLRLPVCILTFLWGIRWEDNFDPRPIAWGFALPTTIWTLFTSLLILLILVAKLLYKLWKMFSRQRSLICNRGKSDWITINLFQKWNLKPWKEHYVAFSREASCTEAKTRPKRGTFHNVGFHKLVILTSWEKSILSTCLTNILALFRWWAYTPE